MVILGHLPPKPELLAPGLELVETPLLKAAISLIKSDSAGDY